MLAILYRLKDHALATVYRIFPDPEASLLAGILLGVETGIPQEVQEAFKTTGTSHIIAISGFNIGIIAGLFTLAFSRLLGRRWGAVAAILGIGLYTVLVGPSPSVLRAAIMGYLCALRPAVGPPDRHQHAGDHGRGDGRVQSQYPLGSWFPAFLCRHARAGAVR